MMDGSFEQPSLKKGVLVIMTVQFYIGKFLVVIVAFILIRKASNAITNSQTAIHSRDSFSDELNLKKLHLILAILYVAKQWVATDLACGATADYSSYELHCTSVQASTLPTVTFTRCNYVALLS